MKKVSLLTVCSIVLAGCTHFEKQPEYTALVSPDGRNDLRLYLSPLAYEVVRDGVVVVAKSPIDMKINGRSLAAEAALHPPKITYEKLRGVESTAIYKKSEISLNAHSKFVDFGDWGIRCISRNDGVAYRFETKMDGEITVDSEKASLVIPTGSAKCWAHKTDQVGCEETIPLSTTIGALETKRDEMIYLPMAYTLKDKCVAVAESDVRDYPILNFTKATGNTLFNSKFACSPLRVVHTANASPSDWKNRVVLSEGGRWIEVKEFDKFLTETKGTRTFPWRTFILADSLIGFCEADIIRALAPTEAPLDFDWVKPGKVAWDWWNAFDNKGENEGCTTENYKRFIDFASTNGVEYVILDEGWSAKLNVWKPNPKVDVPEIIAYAKTKNVGIILWMAWAQIWGEEERVASHFAKMGAKGFKVDFIDRGDADVAVFMEKFAEACAKEKMLVDYHGVYRPTGMEKLYPNIINFEGIHGLECLKWFNGGEQNERAMMFNDVAAVFLRMTAGPLDYTPGAMNNHGIGSDYVGARHLRDPGSVGTRCRQMAMMALYEAPLQMLCDSPTNYEANEECFKFMASTPVVWRQTIGLSGTPDTMAVLARQAKDGAWYVAGIAAYDGGEARIKTDFLPAGEWTAEIFRDGEDAAQNGTSYIHETKRVTAGTWLNIPMAKGGGFIMRIVK